MFKICLLAALVAAALAEGTYIVVAPSQVRPGMDLEISVNILKATGDVTVVAALKDSHGIQIVDASGVFTQGQPGPLTLKVPQALRTASYMLRVSGSGGLTFSNETRLQYSRKSISIFVQTDKAMYKPGQTVNFRTFSIHPDLKLFTGPMTVEIYDKNSNKIKQWLNVQDSTGVITKFLELSDQPVLGDWKIKVTAGSASEEKTFTIAEYVLPKFEVSVELPPFALNSENDITATIRAKYTYGKPVKGTVSVMGKMEHIYRPWNLHRGDPMVTQTANIDGETKIVLPLRQFKAFSNLNTGSLVVIANVTEGLTGITLNGTSRVKFYQHAVKLEFLPSNPKTFKPGLAYTAYLKVAQQDDRPIPQSTKPIQVSIRVTWEEPRPKNTLSPFFQPQQHYYNLPKQTIPIPDTGIVPIQVDMPENAISIDLSVSYDGVSVSKTLSKSYSPSSSYIQLFLRSTQLTAGNVVNFEVKATQPVTDLVYQVLSRGSIVAAGKIAGNNRRTFLFSIPVTSKMAPNARIVVYFVRTDGEIVTDSISFDVDGAFANQVSISMDKTVAKPGDSVNIHVTADPQSVVNLLAVDQSVLLLKSGNDITQAQVLDELKSYDTIKPYSPPVFWGRGGGAMPLARQKRMVWWGYPIYYGGSDANQIFKNAGVVVLTDANVYKHVEVIYRRRWLWSRPMFSRRGGIRAQFPMVQRAEMNRKSKGPLRKQSSLSTEKLASVGRIRSVFPEAWMWLNQTISADGTATISTTVPDTITSWVTSAFAVNSVSGLGVTADATKIKVFRPFFVSLNLPYSVIRGEHVVLQAIVFNYLSQNLDVVVSLPQSRDYTSIEVNANGHEQMVSSDQQTTVNVKAGGAKSVFFPIVPATLGKIDITVSARSTLAADAVRRQLLVEAEGVEKEYNVPVLIDLKQTNSFSKDIPITLPSNVVSGSQKARVTAIGDLMGPSVNGLDSLLKMPTGCGEQNMLGFAPDVFVTNYLKATNQLTGDIEDKAIGFMEKGYQRELTYQHDDGSFSAFGNRDNSGSMWLTAFVVKSFHQAKPHVFIDDKVLTRAIDWMVQRQKSDGSFPEPGRIIHKNMQGGSASGPALSAFVAIALLENGKLTGGIQQKIRNAISKVTPYLENQIATMTDNYALAITSYALQLAQSSQAPVVFAKLNANAIVKDGFKYWHRPQTKQTSSNHYWRPPTTSNAIDTEMTSYALLTYAEKNDFIGGLNIMKWIAAQRNPHGGFSSTQDTVLALQALSEFAKMAYSTNFNIQVSLTAGTFTKSFSISQTNALVLQSVDLPTIPNSIHVSATGQGIALVELAVFFNVEAEVEEPSFEVDVRPLEETINTLVIQTCTRWLKTGASGMAVQEIGIPSGFEADVESIGSVGTLKRVEQVNKKVILYFDEIGTSPVCLRIELQRTGLVAKTQPAPVRVYDYYDPTNQATAFYQSQLLKNSDICSVCADCENCSVKGR